MGATQKLDRIDINILSTLQDQGNITNVNLAEAVGLSPSPCLQRVKRLEEWRAPIGWSGLIFSAL